MLLMLGMLGCFGMDSPVTEVELELLCDVAAEVQQDATVPQKRKLKELATRAAHKQLGPAGVALVGALQEAPPKVRRELLTRAAKDAGLTRYECPALEQLIEGKD